ncbi:hypothetical protein QQS21_006825 [Conoideocrella luteorostrata]|uniref:Peptidase M20 domain-containing protein 2 n=1 Tax=Conoideocrella luteorostrata TaxID=1105319 RepID=A0AAJ0FZY6_9HYPO|nr:hypothetical protein QQS21_006825 [Conoideocrella luteorostrata]
MATDTLAQGRLIVSSRLEELTGELHQVNKTIHSNPELAYEEFIAHDTITAFLEKLGFKVERHAWGLGTSFDASIGSGNRQVIFCAEYDALPDIGHACGHNLIATSSIGAFLGAAAAMAKLEITGRIRLLGTPAEEAGGGKADLIKAGAFDPPESVLAAIMAHPIPGAHVSDQNCSGLAGVKLIACQGIHTEFKGRTAHAAGEPWSGVNALDAAVSAYTNVSLMRQQMHSDDRVHGVFEVGGTVPNVIPDYTRMHWIIRSPTADGCEKLVGRVSKCFEAGATAAACEMTLKKSHYYMNLRANDGLCKAYVEEMAEYGEYIQLEMDKPFNASTDMGNVSHYVPSFHGGIAIPAESGVAMHNPRFAAAAATDEAHAAAIKAAKGMAMLALRVLLDEEVATKARADFQKRDD